MFIQNKLKAHRKHLINIIYRFAIGIKKDKIKISIMTFNK